MGAYSRNAAVGLLLCSEKLFESGREEQWRGEEWILLNNDSMKAKPLNVYLYRKHLDSFATAY